MPDKKEEMKKQSHSNIHVALSAFQGEVKNIKHNGKVDFFSKRTQEQIKYTYALLGDIVAETNPILSRHGLSHRFEISKDGKGIECVVTHETCKEELQVVSRTTVVEIAEDGTKKETVSEEYKPVVMGVIRSGIVPLDLTKPDMKDVGGQITYARRYSLGLALGIATEEDKDIELMEQSHKNVQSFAFTQAKKTIEALSDKEQLDAQIKYLGGELKVAKALKNGEATRAPSLGLQVEQYEELLTLAKTRVDGLDVNADE